MKSSMLISAGLLTAVMLTAGLEVQAQTYALPQDSEEPVITIDYRGERLKRIDDAPTMSILADGRIVMPQSYSHSKAYEGQISQAELQELLAFVIDENRFFDDDPDTIRAKAQQRQRLPVHASTTIIRVNADNRTNEIHHRGLGYAPMEEQTKRLFAIQQRLDQLMSMVKLGGAAEVANWLDVANEELGSKFSDALPLTAKDLVGGGQRPDGSLSVRFTGRDATSVTIEVAADGTRHMTAARN